VTFEVHKSVRLPTNTQASVRWRNLLGQRYVYLNPPDPTMATPVVLRSGDTIAKTASVVDIGQLFNKLGPIVKAIDPGQVNQFLDVVTGALSGNEDNLRSALGNLATITATLASHDDAIGRLVSNVDTVAATVNNRDAEITTVLNNLVDISTTFSQNTQVVDSAITNLNSVSNNVAQLLGNNRAQLDRVIANLQTLLGVVQTKLPQLNTALVGLPTVASKVFSVGSWGEWLNQIVPCGSIQALPNVDINVSCHLDATGPPGGQVGSGSLPTNLVGVGPVLQGLAGG
jgi:phospholipid/cholesterol/gamma-HCH transport system substrate-binding protein